MVVLVFGYFVVFFFKQKTAYEMRISDWSSDVCSSDLVAHTPVALAYAIVSADGTADLYVAPDKLTDAVRQHLGNAVRLHDRTAFAPALAGFAGKRIAADPANAVAARFDALAAGAATVQIGRASGRGRVGRSR